MQGGTDVVGHPLAVEVSEILGDLCIAPEQLGRVWWVGMVDYAQLGMLGVDD